MAIELHLDVELHRLATVFFVQRLKSKLGEALMLVLSSFLRVPRVSALDSWCCRRHHVVARCELHARVLAPRCCARRLRPAAPAVAPPYPAAGQPRRATGHGPAPSPTGGFPFIQLTKLVGCITIQEKILEIQN